MTRMPATRRSYVCMAVFAIAPFTTGWQGATADCQHATLTGSDTIGWDAFGEAVAASDDGKVIAVGAPNNGSKGAVYVFVEADRGWMEEVKLNPSSGSGTVWVYFGHSLALTGDGELLVVGAPGDSTAAFHGGAVYVFGRVPNGWNLLQKITAKDASDHDDFGSAVAISSDGNQLLIGAGYHGKPNVGTVYSFVRDGEDWVEQSRLDPPSTVPGLAFGTAIAMSDDGSRAIVGVGWSQGPEEAYVFDRNESDWVLGATFANPHRDSFGFFGLKVAISADGNRCLVGGSTGGPAVYSEANGTWSTPALLGYDDGHSFAISDDGNRATVTTFQWFGPSFDSFFGGVHVIDLSGAAPTLQAVLTIADPQLMPILAANVATSNDGVTVAVTRQNQYDKDVGDLMVFQPVLGDRDQDGLFDICDNCPALFNPDQANCDQDGIGDVCAIAAGLQDDCDADGMPDECELGVNGVLSYVLDGGVYGTSVGSIFEMVSMLWLNQFRVVGTADHIVAVDIWWGNVPSGSPMTVCVWSDPTNDGDPSDAALLRTVSTTVGEGSLRAFVTVPIPPTYVGRESGSFFVGAFFEPTQWSEQHYPAALDESWPSQFRSWFAMHATPADVTGPFENGIKPIAFSGYPGEWMIRARTAVVPDCDDDGVLDDCQIVSGGGDDLDGDGVLDACEDCDRDGIPDSLEIDRGEEQDCDRNHVPDSCDLAQGRSEDCNGDGVPDQCQVAKWFSIGSGLMSPIGVDSPQEFTMVEPPLPAGDVTVTVKAIGDFGFGSEYLTVRVNGVAVGTVFQETGEDCQWPLVESFMVPRAIWLVAVGAGDAIVTIDPSPGVDSSLCELPSAALVAVAYLAAGSADADSDGVVDGCSGGANPADLNHDGTVDAFDLGILLSQWGPCAVPGVQCVADFNRDGVVNGLDLAILLAAWG